MYTLLTNLYFLPHKCNRISEQRLCFKSGLPSNHRNEIDVVRLLLSSALAGKHTKGGAGICTYIAIQKDNAICAEE